MADVTVTHEGNDERGRYSAKLDGEDAGHLDWIGRGEDVRVATHTLVPDSMRGKGIAGKLVDALIADARNEGFRIVPQCSYVDAQFKRHPEWVSLRA
ncbi:MAG: GNAT family N-acetyltransferase [Sphingomonadaceae bacterium]